MNAKPLSEELLIAEIQAVGGVRERIDLVAKDFTSRRRCYKSVGGWIPGELLGLEIERIGESHRTLWACREQLDQGGFEHPYAENIELLERRSRRSGTRVQRRYKCGDWVAWVGYIRGVNASPPTAHPTRPPRRRWRAVWRLLPSRVCPL